MAANPRLPVTFLFAGQGSQYFQMGAELFREHPVFREWMEIGDRILWDETGLSVLDAVYAADRRIGDPFDRVEATHPAIFLIQHALAKVLEHHGMVADRHVGVSLGEFAAMCVAGMLPFEKTLLTIARQPEIYHRTCEPGGMVAVLGDPAFHRDSPVLSAHSEIAGVNADRHFILSAPAPALPAVTAELKRLGIAHQSLNVPLAFHSRWIEPAAGVCRQLYAGAWLHAGRAPVFSSCLADWIEPDEPDLFWRIVREPMHVRAAIRRLEGEGGAVYIDLSPSGTLAALLKQQIPADSPSRVHAILSPFGTGMTALGRLLDQMAALGR